MDQSKLDQSKLDKSKLNKYKFDMFYGNIDNFVSNLEKNNLTQNEIEYLGTICLEYSSIHPQITEIIKILICDYDLKITSDFIKKHVHYVDMKMFTLLENELNESILEYMDIAALNNLFIMAYSQNNKNLMNRMICSGFNFNKIKNKFFMTKDLNTREDLEKLQFLLDHGLDLSFVSKRFLEHLINRNKNEVFKFFYDNGVNFDILIKEFPQNFNETYLILIDIGIDPKNIAYLFYGIAKVDY